MAQTCPGCHTYTIGKLTHAQTLTMYFWSGRGKTLTRLVDHRCACAARVTVVCWPHSIFLCIYMSVGVSLSLCLLPHIVQFYTKTMICTATAFLTHVVLLARSSLKRGCGDTAISELCSGAKISWYDKRAVEIA